MLLILLFVAFVLVVNTSVFVYQALSASADLEAMVGYSVLVGANGAGAILAAYAARFAV